MLKWIKNSDEARINVITDLRRDLSDLGRLLVTSLKIPLTFIPDFRGESPIIHPIANVMYGYTALSLPILVNLIFVVFKQLNKILSRVYLITRMNILVMLKYYSIHGFRSELWLGMIFTWFSTWDLFSVVFAGFIAFLVERLIKSNRFSMWTRMSIHSTKGYAYWPAYDPINSTVTTLSKVADKNLLEDSGAYKQIIRMCGSSAPIKGYLSNRRKSETGTGKRDSNIKKIKSGT